MIFSPRIWSMCVYLKIRIFSFEYMIFCTRIWSKFVYLKIRINGYSCIIVII